MEIVRRKIEEKVKETGVNYEWVNGDSEVDLDKDIIYILLSEENKTVTFFYHSRRLQVNNINFDNDLRTLLQPVINCYKCNGNDIIYQSNCSCHKLFCKKCIFYTNNSCTICYDDIINNVQLMELFAIITERVYSKIAEKSGASLEGIYAANTQVTWNPLPTKGSIYEYVINHAYAKAPKDLEIPEDIDREAILDLCVTKAIINQEIN